jgi:large subunit ribosomal protein L15
MKYHDLKLDRQKSTTRVGRGISAGKGKTAGRGTKGQNSRTGSSKRPGFEGGQTPLAQRLPKLRGIAKGSLSRSAKKAKAENIYTGDLNKFKGLVDNYTLVEAGYISSPNVKVKVISKGALTAKLEVNLQLASVSAKEAIVKAGGTFNKVPVILKPSKQ